MAHQRNTFTLGLVIIVGVGLAVFGVVFIGSRSFESRDAIVVRVPHNENVPQLKKGAAIVCGPQTVGTVTGVAIVEAASLDDPTIQDFLYFEVSGMVNQSVGLRSDCRIGVEGSLLGGQGLLRIEDRGTSANPASANTPIIAHSEGISTAIEKLSDELDSSNPRSLLSTVKGQLDPQSPMSLIAKIHRSIDHINEMTGNLKMAVDPSSSNGVLTKVDRIMTHLDNVTHALEVQMQRGNGDVLIDKVHAGLDRLDTALVEVVGILQDNRPGVFAAVANIEGIAKQVNDEMLPAIESQLDPTNEDGLLSKLHVAMSRMNTSLADINVVSRDVRSVMTLSRHQIVALIDNGKEASDHLKAAAKTLREKPWKLIHKPTDQEAKEAYVLDAVRGFASASESLDDAMAQLNAALEDQDGDVPADHPALVQAREKLQQTLAQFGEAEQKLWSQLELE